MVQITGLRAKVRLNFLCVFPTRNELMAPGLPGCLPPRPFQFLWQPLARLGAGKHVFQCTCPSPPWMFKLCLKLRNERESCREDKRCMAIPWGLLKSLEETPRPTSDVGCWEKRCFSLNQSPLLICVHVCEWVRACMCVCVFTVLSKKVWLAFPFQLVLLCPSCTNCGQENRIGATAIQESSWKGKSGERTRGWVVLQLEETPPIKNTRREEMRWVIWGE